MKIQHLILFLLFFTSAISHGFMTVAETANIIPTNTYRVGFEPQVLTNQGGGINATVFLDRGVNESTMGRVYLGAGAQDFTTGASVKYIPFPDVDQQPAMGIRGGARYTRNEGLNFLSVEVAPLLSKKISTEKGDFHPYVAVPFNYNITKEKNFVSSQMVFGNEWNVPEMDRTTVGAELGFSLSDSYSYISAYISYPLEQFKKRGSH